MWQLILATDYQLRGSVLVTLVAVGVWIGLIMVILGRERWSDAGRCYALLGIAVVIWLTGYAGSAATDSAEVALVWARIGQYGVSIGPAALLAFGLVASDPLNRRQPLLGILWGVSALLIVAISTFPEWVLTAPHPRQQGGFFPGYAPGGAVLFVYLSVAYIDVIRRFHRVRRNARVGSTAHHRAGLLRNAFLFATLTSVDFLPAYGLAVPPIGPVVIIVPVAMTAYVVFRHRFTTVDPAFAADQIVQAMEEPLIVLDHAGVVRVANDAATSLLARSRETLVGSEVPAILCGEERVGFEDWLMRVKAGSLMSVNGSETTRQVLASVATVLDSRGFEAAHVCILRDVTAATRAAEQDKRLQAEAWRAERMESLGLMASGVAHDFNNLLMGVLGNAEVARGHLEDPSRAAVHLDRIARAAERAAALTDQMLTYSGKTTLEKESVSLGAVVEDMVDLLKATIPKTARLDLELNPDVPEVLGNATQLRQVVMNLITNAAESLPGGKGRILVSTHLAEPEPDGGDRFVAFEVTDDGGGMTPEVLERIFDPFFTTKFEGRGLGMAVVHGVVKAHHGVVRVHSELGRGSRVSVLLPGHHETPPPMPVRPGASPAPLTGHVLLIDDEAAARDPVADMVRMMGFEVTEREDGRSGLQALLDNPGRFSLVVLDRSMPEMSGDEVIAQASAIPDPPPILLVSGLGSDHRPPPAGVPVLKKPFRLADLRLMVDRMLGGSGGARSPDP